jgi:uncharacterized membrane protein YkvA (DUF1232 family)
MKFQLTYSDRSFLLGTFDTLKNASNHTDSQILESIGNWAKQLDVNYGYELALTRDITSLSRYLTEDKLGQDITDIARGALLYVLRSTDSEVKKYGTFNLLDDAFICGYAVHEIRTRLGDTAVYSLPKLTKQEQKRAEDLFVKFLDFRQVDDFQLISSAEKISKEFINLSASGLFHRFCKNINFLISVLTDPKRNEEHKSYARAALHYLVLEEDALDDSLGIVGYLDDNFIIQLAVDFIEPNREPWLELLNEIVGAWPFLNHLIIDDGEGGRPIAEYMLINSALSCTDIQSKEASSSIFLITPVTGPTPFLLGYLSALGEILSHDKADQIEHIFTVGQKVIVDNNAIAEFAGYREEKGRKMFGLTQYPMKGGQCNPCTFYWPITDLSRIASADESRIIRGQLRHDLTSSDIPLPALDYFFRDGNDSLLSTVENRIITVMPVAMANEMAKRFTLFGHSLKDTIPMGHLTVDGTIKSWSNRFGKQEPILVFISDLDDACACAEENPSKWNKLIIEAQGRNAEKTASLYRLRQFNIHSIIISTETISEKVDLVDEENFCLWEWQRDDFTALSWDARKKDHAGPILKYEERLRSLPSSSINARKISFPLADKTFEAANLVRSLVYKRGEDRLAELDEIVLLVFSIVSHLLRSASPFNKNTPSASSIEANLSKLFNILKKSRYLSESECEVINYSGKLLQDFFETLKQENPKAILAKEILTDHKEYVIICPDARLRPDLEWAYKDTGTQVITGFSEALADYKGAIIPGWFRKDRLGKLLVPPVTQDLCLLLYEIEQSWFEGFLNERQRNRQKRSTRNYRSKLFPKIEGWVKPDLKSITRGRKDEKMRFKEYEAIHRDILGNYRQQAYRRAKSGGGEEEVSAYLVLFEGGAYSFLTEFYQANVVTHLLEASINEMADKADIKLESVKNLNVGDALLFRRGTESDVIRAAADKVLPEGTRSTALLWRKALINYAVSKELTSEELWQYLNDAGCPLKPETIRGWLFNDYMIAPKAHKRDVQIISEVTGDEAISNNLDKILSAISEVRSAHLKVSNLIAKNILNRAVTILKEEDNQASMVEIESNVVLVRVNDIDAQQTMVRSSIANRLIEGDLWLE